MKRCSLHAAWVLGLVSLTAHAYPNGTPLYVTDMVPACASCHAAADAAYMPELSREAALGETPERKHYAQVNGALPPSPYAELTERQRERLIALAKLIDEKASIEIKAPSVAAPGREVRVTITARGGNGPVLGVMLVDRPLRYQARSITAEGWGIVSVPAVRGADGKPQTEWLERRVNGGGGDLAYIMVMDEPFDPEKGTFPSAELTYRLRAPSTKGRYSLTAALLYGTENTEQAGVTSRPSGRILFSKSVMVEVR